MDTTSRSSTALLDRASSNVAALLRRFENIIALAPDQQQRAATANEGYQMQVETAALIRAAEDLTALTRRLKELWLFGQLDTLGTSAAEGQIDIEAHEVAKLMETAIRPPDGQSSETNSKMEMSRNVNDTK